MLVKPSIVKMPSSEFPKIGNTKSCANSGYTYDGTTCQGNFSCASSFTYPCADSSYNACGSGLTGGILIGGAIAYTGGVFITGAVIT